MNKETQIKVLWAIVLIAVTVCLSSCSAPKLYQQGISKIERAIEKDPSIKLPADTTVITNTVTEIDTVDNEIIKTVTNTITETINDCNYDELKTKSRRELRYARKMYNDSLKHERKMYKQETKRLNDSLAYQKKLNRELTKQIKDTNDKEEKLAKEDTKQKRGNWFTRLFGKLWWLLLLIGFIIGGNFKTFFNFKRIINGKNTTDST